MSESAQTISSDKLIALTGLSDRRHRQLASEGYVPKPINGQWPLVETLTGLFRYYSELHEKTITTEYGSMGQCAAATGIPLATLKTAKAAGCSAFKNSRVNFPDLVRWLFQQEESAVDWGDLLKQYQAKREKVKLDEEQGRSIDRSEVTASIAKGMAVLFGELEKLVQSLPPVLKGNAESEIQNRIQGAVDVLKKSFRAAITTHQTNEYSTAQNR